MTEKSYTALDHCIACGEAYCIILDRRLRNSLPPHVCSGEICDKCKKLTPKYVWLLVYKNKEAVENRELPTGAYAVSRAAVRRVFEEDENSLPDSLLAVRISEETARQIGLFDIEARTTSLDEALKLTGSEDTSEEPSSPPGSDGEEA